MLHAPLHDLRPEVDVAVEAGFDFGSEEYRAFWKPDRATAFQAPLWLDMIHRRLVPAMAARQHTITVRSTHDRRLIAVMPMVMQAAKGVRILQPADFGICDYNSIIGDRARLSALALREEVRQRIVDAFRGADLVMFRKVRSDDFDPALLMGRMSSSPGENSAYACHTGLDPDHFRLKVLARKFTKELGRLQRQTEREQGPYEHRLLNEPADIRAAFAFLRQVHSQRHPDGVLSREVFADFYLDYALASAACGESETWMSTISGEPVAVLFGLSGDGIFHGMLIGSDIGTHERISPGMQILYRVMHAQLAAGRAVTDLGLGDPGYKTHFRPQMTPMINHSLALTPTGRAMGMIYHRSKSLKNLLKGLVPHVR